MTITRVTGLVLLAAALTLTACESEDTAAAPAPTTAAPAPAEETTPPVLPPSPTAAPVATEEAAPEFSFPGSDGYTVLETLAISSGLDYTLGGEGVSAQLESVNGITPTIDQYWAIYVNGELQERGMGVIVSPQDTVTVKLQDR